VLDKHHAMKTYEVDVSYSVTNS